MDYSYKNVKGIYEHVLNLGMLSPPEDIIAAWMVFKNVDQVDSMLELGSYLGGGLGMFNQLLTATGHSGVKFTGVDSLEFIGAGARQSRGAWYTDHFNRCLTEDERGSLASLDTAQQATEWIQERTLRLTNTHIDLKCVLSENDLDDQQYDIIHHDYGDGVEENLTTMRHCVPRLKDSGIYIVDDWCTGAPLRTVATVIAQQEGLLYPILWGKNKVFYAKNPERAQQVVSAMLCDPENNPKLFKGMPGSDYFGTGYKSIRMHWQAIQWS
jgi:hypothetical protein